MIEKLWELQSVMSVIADRQRGLEEKPEGFAEVDAEYVKANREMEEIRQKIEQLNKERRKIEGDLQDGQELLKKYQGQLMLVKNQVQYAAAWKEIDATRKTVKDLEESLLARMTEIDTLQSDLDAREAGFGELKGRYDTAYNEWQDSLAGLREEVTALRSKAQSIEADIPERVRAEFQRIFQHRQGVAVARIANNACTGCRVTIRPQTLQQLKRGELTFCEGCRRILYLEGSPA